MSFGGKIMFMGYHIHHLKSAIINKQLFPIKIVKLFMTMEISAYNMFLYEGKYEVVHKAG